MATVKFKNDQGQWEEVNAAKLETPRNINGVPFDGSQDITIPGSGGTSDYLALSNKPQINGVELDGNKTLDDLNIEPKKGNDDFYVTNAEKTQGALATGNAVLPTVKNVADKAVVSVPFKTFNKYADITTITSLTLILVTQDETNDNYPTFYLHDGINLNWVVTQ